MTVNIVLDARGVEADCPAPLKVVVRKQKKSAYISLGIKVKRDEWDSLNSEVIRHPQRRLLNALIDDKFRDIEVVVRELEFLPDKSAFDIRDEIVSRVFKKDEGNFVPFFEGIISLKNGSSKRNYGAALKSLDRYCNELSTYDVSDVNKPFILSYIDDLRGRGIAENTIRLYVKLVKHVLNEAVAEDLIAKSPLKGFVIEAEKTQKRNLSVEQMRGLFSLKVKNKSERDCLNLFLVSFLLRGLNTIDVLNIERVKGGRVFLYRSKTKVALDIKVEQEVEDICKKHGGLIGFISYLRAKGDYNHWNNTTRLCLKKLVLPKGVLPLPPNFSMYWARHTWASLCSELDVPKETIAKGLGHAGIGITEVYINFSSKKIDDANRKVIDYILNK